MANVSSVEELLIKYDVVDPDGSRWTIAISLVASEDCYVQTVTGESYHLSKKIQNKHFEFSNTFIETELMVQSLRELLTKTKKS